MKSFALLLCAFVFAFAGIAFAGDQKQLPNQAGNDNLDVRATVLLTPPEMRQALGGEDMQHGYIIVRIKAQAKTESPLRVGPDDFTLLSRKDGQRIPAASPHQVAGGGAVLIVKPAQNQPGGDGTASGGTVWAGVSVRKRSTEVTNEDGSVAKPGAEPENPMVTLLTQKALPDKEIKSSAEGLLYFAVDTKVKPKDLSLIYNGQGGKLILDFK